MLDSKQTHPIISPEGITIFIIFELDQTFLLCQRETQFNLAKLFDIYTSLKIQSQTKGLLVNFLKAMQKIERSLKNFPPTISYPHFHMVLTQSEFCLDYTAQSVTLNNLSNKYWNQIHFICLIQYLISAAVNRASNRMRLTCSIDLNHAPLCTQI